MKATAVRVRVDETLHVVDQIINSGGSRISQAGRGATPKFGAKTYYLARFLPKTA